MFKNNLKIFKKPLDKQAVFCYNQTIEKGCGVDTKGRKHGGCNKIFSDNSNNLENFENYKK